METTQGISLYSYLYLKLAKPQYFYYLLCFFFYIIKEQEGKTGSAQRVAGGWGEVAQIMYTHVSSCKLMQKQ
jgi:hypothetical protein